MDAKTLKLERSLTDAELGRVIERAADMQRQSAEDRANAIDVVAVGGEVDLDAKYVQAALAELDAARKADVEAAKQSAHRARWMKTAIIGAAIVLTFALLAAAKGAARRLQSAQEELHAAETRLQGALARQANLIPQLVALGGGDPKPLLVGARKVIQADSVQARLHAADDFAATISEALTALPAGDHPGALNMQHEVAGAQNRITTELTRYKAAVARLERANRGVYAGIANALGWNH